MADIAHPAGLIAKGLLASPFEHCHFVTSTTHKTLRGPRGGIILMGKDFENPFGLKDVKGNVRMMSNLLNMAVFPGTQGGPLVHVMAAKAVCFLEAMQPEFVEYQKHVVTNAKALAETLSGAGFRVVSGGTDTHLLLLDVFSKGLRGKEAEQALDRARITVNKNAIPFDANPPMNPSGIRLGSPAVTTRGFRETEMLEVGALIAEVLNNISDEQAIASVRQRVGALAERFPLYRWKLSTVRA
jgi:glycine hydroxymethyltransferase